MATRRAVIMAAGAGALASGVPTPAGRDVLVVVEKSGHAVGFYETASGRLLRRVALPDRPHEMVFDSRRRFAYVGRSTPGRSTASTAWTSATATGGSEWGCLARRLQATLASPGPQVRGRFLHPRPRRR
ncbi:hypothetical protein [Streptomyces parvulus]|uniref:hypothetical protein n=1 Tax=Streptomyces parvulus TaxID=146923 RepID=UPI003676A1AE